jgi:hypothetical protein
MAVLEAESLSLPVTITSTSQPTLVMVFRVSDAECDGPGTTLEKGAGVTSDMYKKP